MPVEIFLAPNGRDVIRRPVDAFDTLYDEVLYEYEGAPKTAPEIANEVRNVRSDMYQIEATFTLAPGGDYDSGIYVRYNPTNSIFGTEKSAVKFRNNEVYVDRTQSTLLTYPEKRDTWHYPTDARTFDVRILVDRSLLEVYVNEIATFTTRIYPKYGDSDYISLFDNNGNMRITKFKVTQMKGCYKDEVVPAYYGNVGNLADL